MKTFPSTLRIAATLLVAAVLAGCVQPPEPSTEPVAPAAPAASAPTAPVVEQRKFASPAEAIQALQSAAQAKDVDALHAIFGSQLDDLLSGDPRQDAIELDNFSKALAQVCTPVQKDDNTVVLDIGAQNWPFPIPLVQQDGQWHFDTAAGADEILNRRIGQDELTAIGVCHAYVSAQREYASEDRDGSGVLKYAQRLMSNPGKRDGLYWDPAPGEDLSPLGPLVAQARTEGYDEPKNISPREAFHGYYFKVLKEQGPDAPGGAYSYVINGNMVAGFALAAYPAHWGDSGIMTFIVSKEGKVYESNLGPQSETAATAMTAFDPDSSWTVVQDNPPPP
jgi:hypothetical protein